MRYRLLGRTGCRVSEVCLGTMTFGAHDLGWGQVDESEVRAMMTAFGDAGGNFIDTSDVYTGGTSERYVGEMIASDRDHWVVATKFGSSFAGDPLQAGNSRRHMVRAVEASLRRLNTDYIDLYFVHVWDGLTVIDDIVRGLDDLVRAGKIVYGGLSNTPAWACGRAGGLADARAGARRPRSDRRTRSLCPRRRARVAADGAGARRRRAHIRSAGRRRPDRGGTGPAPTPAACRRASTSAP